MKLPDDIGETTYQVTPLKVRDTLYLCTPHNWAIALDAATGKEKWKYDPNVGLNPDRQHQTCRGVSYYADPALPPGQPCAERVYLPTSDARLIALDAANGQICPSFADKGTLHLEKGMPYNPAGYYYSTSPPVIAAGKIIVGGAVNDNYSIHEQSGVIRAFDINTGALVWNWDSGNPDVTTPLAGGPDLYAQLAQQLVGLQVPTKSLACSTSRSATRRRTSSARDAATMSRNSRRRSSRSISTPARCAGCARPCITISGTWTCRRNRRSSISTPQRAPVPALVGPTKQGDIYVLDRRTGEPIIPIEEVPAPAGAIEGDHTSPTQPVSALTFMPQPLTGKDMWGVSMFDQLACRIEFLKLRYEGRYTPPSLQGSLIYPGNFGVFNWGGVAVDPGASDHVRHADLSRLHLKAGSASRCSAAGRRHKGQRTGPQSQ